MSARYLAASEISQFRLLTAVRALTNTPEQNVGQHAYRLRASQSLQAIMIEDWSIFHVVHVDLLDLPTI